MSMIMYMVRLTQGLKLIFSLFPEIMKIIQKIHTIHVKGYVKGYEKKENVIIESSA